MKKDQPTSVVWTIYNELWNRVIVERRALIGRNSIEIIPFNTEGFLNMQRNIDGYVQTIGAIEIDIRRLLANNFKAALLIAVAELWYLLKRNARARICCNLAEHTNGIMCDTLQILKHLREQFDS